MSACTGSSRSNAFLPTSCSSAHRPSEVRPSSGKPEPVAEHERVDHHVERVEESLLGAAADRGQRQDRRRIGGKPGHDARDQVGGLAETGLLPGREALLQLPQRHDRALIERAVGLAQPVALLELGVLLASRARTRRRGERAFAARAAFASTFRVGLGGEHLGEAERVSCDRSREAE